MLSFCSVSHQAKAGRNLPVVTMTNFSMKLSCLNWHLNICYFSKGAQIFTTSHTLLGNSWCWASFSVKNETWEVWVILWIVVYLGCPHLYYWDYSWWRGWVLSLFPSPKKLLQPSDEITDMQMYRHKKDGWIHIFSHTNILMEKSHVPL